ncbi:hypothetical protein K491DRAFT_696666 [Lophiostoma macrostomum CBS 122681]|uniref:Uncharacterized protein n=1 Tax=Lophiostoma macrostomum CBS 122681 TaxID=1314788 RepID=A0A6A6SXI5_9PLEO|nr:hypothetical protein K491DRAFT_696666 [Lophiostoma macrostomum CBS 122681]
MTIQNIWNDQLSGSEHRDPSIAFLLRNLVNSQFTFQYHRLVRTRSGGRDNPEEDEGILELAWMIAPTVQQALRKREFSGTDGRNIFFVLHLHFSHFHRENTTYFAGEYVPAVYAMTAFHGRSIDRSPVNNVLGQIGHLVNRVSGHENYSGGANERIRVLDSSNKGVKYRFIGYRQEYWYPGTDPHEMRPRGNSGEETFLRLLHDLGHHIRCEQFTQAEKLHLVWGTGQDGNGDTMNLDWRTHLTGGSSASYTRSGPWKAPTGVPIVSEHDDTPATLEGEDTEAGGLLPAVLPWRRQVSSFFGGRT